MKFFCRHRGSVSVFLAIILLPMITLSGILVDAANLNMSKAVVESAGELAAGSALATYDTVLEDVYGLFAMSQNNEELQANVAKYFEDTLSALDLLDSGVTAQSQMLGQAQEYVNGIMGAITAEDVSDNFLNISVSDVAVEPLADSNLGNPAIMKNQIVEFMKYRGVVEVGLDLLGTLNAFKTINDKSEVADKKAEVDKKIGDLGDASSAFYKALVVLDQEIAKIQVEFDKVQWDACRTKLESANQTIVTYLVDEAEISLNYRMDGENGYSIENAGKVSEEELTYDLIGKLNTELTTVFGSDPNKITGTSGLENTRVYLEETESGAHIELAFETLNQYMKAVVEVYKCWRNMNAATDPEQGEKEADADYEARISALHASRDAADADATDKFKEVWSIVKDYQDFYDEYQSGIEDARRRVGADLTDVYNQLRPLYTAVTTLLEKEVDEKWAKIFGGRNFIEDVVSLGEKVIEEIGAVNTANNNLSTAAENYANKQSKDDYYEVMASEADKNSVTYDKAQVQEVVDQVKAIKAFLADDDGLQARLFGKIYGETFIELKVWKDDDGAHGKKYGKAAKSTLKASVKNNTFSKEKDAEYYEDYVLVNVEKKEMTSSVYLKQIAERITVDGVTIGVPSFYLYLISTYGGQEDKNEKSDDNLTESAKDLNGEGKDKVEESAPLDYNASIFNVVDSNSTKTRKEGIDSVDSEEQDGIVVQLQSMIDMVQGLFGILDKGFEGARDNLFVTEYIYENFSNYSFAMEKHKDKKDDRFTMTNVAINEANNPMYGCEVEYILYGQKGSGVKGGLFSTDAGPQENIKIVKGNIFAIRFVCNSIYALTAGDIDAQTLPPALAIQAATLGVFPYQVAQVVFKLCLAMAETAYDMNQLMEGEKVALIKNSQTWTFSVTGMVRALKEEVIEEVADVASEVLEESITNLSTRMQEFVNDTTELVKSEVDDLASDITGGVVNSLTGSLNDAVSAMSQAITDEVEKIYVEIFSATGSLKLDEASIKERITQALNHYLENAKDSGAYSEQVITFLQGQTSKLVDVVMSAKLKVDGKNLSLSGMLQNYNQQLTDVENGIKNTMEVTAQDYMNLLNCVQEGITSYLEEAKGVIDSTVQEWTSELSDEISGEINAQIEKGEEKLKEASTQAVENVKAKVNNTLNEYFPDTEGGITVDGKKTDSSGMASMFCFGYEDYLRLFLFLQLSGKRSNDVITRIGDVITINIKTDGGMSAYYAASGMDGHPAKDKFSMSEAYTYVGISAEISTKPLLLSQEIFTKGANLGDTDGFWNYSYSTIAGY